MSNNDAMNEQETDPTADPHGEHLFCPANAVLNLLNGRWTLHIVRALLDGHRRFNDIARTQGINPRTLRERLRELEEEGVVTRRVIRAIPPHVEYALTPKGEALNGIFGDIAQWGITWMKPKGAELIDAVDVSLEEGTFPGEGKVGEREAARKRGEASLAPTS